HLRFISNGEADAKPAMSQPRVLVVLGERSRATVVESYVGPEGIDYFTNAVTEVVLGDGAVLEHYTLQHESTAAYHLAATHLAAARDASYAAHSITLGGAFSRNEFMTRFHAVNASCALDAFYVADGD